MIEGTLPNRDDVNRFIFARFARFEVRVSQADVERGLIRELHRASVWSTEAGFPKGDLGR